MFYSLLVFSLLEYLKLLQEWLSAPSFLFMVLGVLILFPDLQSCGSSGLYVEVLLNQPLGCAE